MSAIVDLMVAAQSAQAPQASIAQDVIEFVGGIGRDLFEHPPASVEEAMKMIGAASLLEWIYTHPWWSLAIGIGGVWIIGSSQSSKG